MNCRICGSDSATEAGQVEYYAGFAWTVYDCLRCGCRFTKHDDSIYDWLHKQPESIYSLYRDLAGKAKPLFVQGDLEGLKRRLSESSKYKFIIESVGQHPKNSRVLEVGCSRGQLTSYFILAGYDILGTDVSSEAIAAANASFGKFFVTADSTAISQKTPYDVIYHTGMIGCVADPIRTTRELLNLLRPGGKLLFNAPNKAACALARQLWIDAAAPPDVVTLFRPGFWTKHFSDVANIRETIETFPPERAFAIGLRRKLGPKWRKPQPTSLEASANHYKGGHRPDSEQDNRIWASFERAASLVARTTGLAKLFPPQATPFGLFVTMTKK